MAPGSEADRSQQIQAIATLQHRAITDPALEAWLDAAEAAVEALPPADRRNLYLMRRQWVETNALSAPLAKEVARIGVEGNALHTKHKPTGDWPAMRHWYAHCFDTARAVGEAKCRAMPGQFASTYEALLDSYSPGMQEATITAEFARLEQELPALIRAAREWQAAMPPPLPLQGPFPRDQQVALCHRLIAAVGFDFGRGRFDLCDAHPSSGGTPDDARTIWPRDIVWCATILLGRKAG